MEHPSSPRDSNGSNDLPERKEITMADLKAQLGAANQSINGLLAESKMMEDQMGDIYQPLLELTDLYSLQEKLSYFYQYQDNVRNNITYLQTLASQENQDAQASLPIFTGHLSKVQEVIQLLKRRQQQEQVRLQLQKVDLIGKQVDEICEEQQRALLQVKGQNEQIHDLQGTLRVFVKIRPAFSHDNEVMIEWKSPFIIRFFEKQPGLYESKQDWIEHHVDFAFPPNIRQQEVFPEVEYLVEDFLSGRNKKLALILSGQKGSGKTYTAFGTNQCFQGSCLTKDSGIVPRALEKIFRTIQKERKKGRFMALTMQFRQYFLDKPFSKTKSLFQPEPKPQLFVTQEFPSLVVNLWEALAILAKKQRSLKVANTMSNRLHMLLSLRIFEGADKIQTGMISFLDLAGNIKFSNAHPYESIYINSSITELRQCLRCIKRQELQVWRGSLIVQSLKNELEKAKIAVIVTFSPGQDDEEQNKASLKFVTQISS